MPQTLAPSIVTSRDPKGLKFISVVEAAYNKAGLSEDEAQFVNDALGLSKLVADFIAEHRTPKLYKDEEVKSNYGYLSGYNPGVQDLDRQIAVLQGLFPGLGGANADYLAKVKSGEIKLPQTAEKFFAIPNIWNGGVLRLFGNNYCAALQKVLDVLKQTRNSRFYNCREGQIDEQHLRQSDRAVEFFQKLSEAQGNPDILLVPAQFGKRHAGRSIRRARVVIASTSGEFSLGAFAVGVMLLTHPERLQHLNDLWIDCAGDEANPGGNGDFSSAPFFRFVVGGLRFDFRFVDSARAGYGSASGSFPPASPER